MTDQKVLDAKHVDNVELYPIDTNTSYDAETLKQPAARIDYSGAHEKTDPAEIRLVKKLDRWIMPMLWSMYWLNYLDRNAIALARLSTLEDDLKLTGPFQHAHHSHPAFVVHVWLHGCLGCGDSMYGIGDQLHRPPSHPLLPWCHRGAVLPGALYILSIFYTRKEIATRISILYTGNILATAFAGLIAAGVFAGLEGSHGIAGWQWLFLLQGGVTFVIAVIAAFILPDDPLNTKWLTPEERLLANSRIVVDTVGASEKTTVWQGLKNAASDPKLWLFAFMQHMHLAANGFKNFFPTAVKTLGFSRTITLCLTCPPYLIAGIVSILWSISSGKFNERTWHITIAKAVAIFGFVLGCATLNTGARYFAMCVFAIGTYAVNSIILGWVSATCGQTKEKKSVSLAIVNTIANASFIWTPYLWPDSDEPRYAIAMSSSAAFSFACAAGAWGMRIWLKRANKKIRQSNDESILAFAY
ncbi:hypothetical protein LTR97_005299 [Elasticomyces elasticus]|uniref:Major facilitator superfamily (MFS) profile domain-containing protein n=1 Tax=Elasticomyces elasticus TaxID=574655 RepID=A0AAN7WBZ0_9PEZI|nr:hypothetical protein LTR97_005299 [Elasticomyces elasticus]